MQPPANLAYGFWFELFFVLAIGAGVIVVGGAVVATVVRPAAWKRTVWRRQPQP